MMQRLLHIKDITPDLHSWSVRVLVESKTSPRQSMNSPKKYQRFTLVDETGTKVLATVFDLDINQFDKALCLLETYTISNARVISANLNFDCYGNKYQWILSHRTVITRELERVIPPSIVVPQFASFRSLVPRDHTKTIDVLAIVIKKFEQRTIEGASRTYVIHEFALINDENKPIMLALWNNIATSEGNLIMSSTEAMPIISVTKLSVSNHYGMSLGSTPSTTIIVDPAIPEAQRLKTWRANNQRVINEALLEIDDVIKTQQSSVQSMTTFHNVADVERADDAGKFNLKVKVRVINHSQKFYYMSCDKCHSSYAAELNWPLDCRKCNQRTVAKPREMVVVNIFDNSGSLDVTIFGEDAVKIIQMNAIMAMEMHNAGDAPSIDRMNAAIESIKFVVKLKKYYKVRYDGIHAQYTVLSLVAENEEKSVAPIFTTTEFSDDADIITHSAKSKKVKRRFSAGNDLDMGSSRSNKKLKEGSEETEATVQADNEA